MIPAPLSCTESVVYAVMNFAVGWQWWQLGGSLALPQSQYRYSPAQPHPVTDAN